MTEPIRFTIARRGQDFAIQLSAADRDLLDGHRWRMNPSGYVQGRRAGEHGRTLYLHRVVVARVLGREPHEVDHVNGDRQDCRRENLREVEHRQNQQNRHKVRSSTGVRGVFYDVRRHRFSAEAKLNGEHFHLGRFDTVAEAEAVVVAWRREHMPFSEIDK